MQLFLLPLIFLFRGLIRYEISRDSMLIIKVFGLYFGTIETDQIKLARKSSAFDLALLNTLNLSNRIFSSGSGILVKTKRVDFLQSIIITPYSDEFKDYVNFFKRHSVWMD
jgi:hypothetical protein